MQVKSKGRETRMKPKKNLERISEAKGKGQKRKKIKIAKMV